MFEITTDATEYIKKKGNNIMVWMETYHSSGG